MNAYSKVQQSRGSEAFDNGIYRVVVYPNVIELWDLGGEGERIATFLPEQWAAFVQFVGIRGLEVTEG